MFAKRVGLGGLALAAVVASSTASAAIDVSTVVTQIGEALVPVGLIGLAVLTALGGVKLWKLVRRAM